MGLDKKTYGIFSDPGNDTAAALVNHRKPSELERMNQIKAEKIYKGAAREPLGKTVDRNIVLPSKFTEGNAAHDRTGGKRVVRRSVVC